MQDIPKKLWAFSISDIGTIESATSIKTTIDNTLLLPNIHQCPLTPHAVAGIMLITQDYLKWGLMISWISPHNSLFFSSKKRKQMEGDGDLHGISEL